MQKNVAGQLWTVFAFDETDNTPKTGDAANITGTLYIDGASNAIDDTNPTELSGGYYQFGITQAESNGDQITIVPVSGTANIQVVGYPATYDTTAPGANASVSQTGDSYAIVNHATYGNDQLVRSTTPANSLDVSATGEAGLDFDNIKNATGAHTLTNITIPVCSVNSDMVGTDNAALAATALTDATWTDAAAQALIDWINGGRLDLILDAIPTTPMRGTDSAALAATALTDATWTDAAAGALIDWINGGRLDLILDAIPTTPMRGTDNANTTKTGYALSAAGIDGILDEVVEGSITLRQATNLFLAVLTGKTSGGGTTTLTFRDTGDSKNRLVVTVDANNDRTAVGTRDGS